MLEPPEPLASDLFWLIGFGLVAYLVWRLSLVGSKKWSDE
jgi:hypothetical protein